MATSNGQNQFINAKSLGESLAPATAEANAEVLAAKDKMVESNFSPESLIFFQKALSTYTIVTQLTTAIVKELTDTVKGIIQKIG